MKPGIKGRVALVTGGSRGIGRSVALRLAREGADVAVGFFRNREGAEKTAVEIQEHGARSCVVKGHVGDEARIAEMVDHVVAELGTPTLLVSNAASGVLRPIDQIGAREWDWTLSVNARALLLLANALRPGMIAAGSGRIVALTSLGSDRVLPFYGSVGPSKAALEALVRYLAAEGARDGIIANAVSAGVVDTDALQHFPNRAELLATAARRTPAGRIVTPDDIAGVVAYLCSDEASMIRGQTITVDGGYSLVG